MLNILPAILAVSACIFVLVAGVIVLLLSSKADRKVEELLCDVADMAVRVYQLERRIDRAAVEVHQPETAEAKEKREKAEKAAAEVFEGLQNILTYSGTYTRKEGEE